MLTPAVLYQDSTFRMAHYGCVVGAAWLDAPHASQMGMFAMHARRVSAMHEGSFLFNIIVDGTPSFDPKVREEAARLTAEGVNRRGAGHLILVEGFRGAAVRAFLSSLLVINRPKTPTVVVADIPAAVKHACTCLGGARPEADSRELTRFIQWCASREGVWPPPW